jgi:imidazoleglycerol-phosphate dehydratase
MNARLTLHIVLRYSTNAHHAVEVSFKAFARALGEALSRDPRVKGVPSTKGVIQT